MPSLTQRYTVPRDMPTSPQTSTKRSKVLGRGIADGFLSSSASTAGRSGTILQPYEAKLMAAIAGAWDDWKALPLAGKLLFPGRSRACLVFDFFVGRAITAFAGDKGVHVSRRDETAKFMFDGKVVLRFKKADDSGLGSNIQTQATLKFVDQERQLPGMPDVHKVELVYMINRLQTRIDEVAVVARDGNICLWS